MAPSKAPRLPTALHWTRSEEVFGRRIDFGSIPRIVRYLDVESALLMLCKACWVLESWGHASQGAQDYLCGVFLRDPHLSRARALLRQRQRIIWFRAQMHCLMKYVAQYGKTATGKALAEEDLTRLGEAALAIVDLIDAECKVSHRGQQRRGLAELTMDLATGSYLIRSPDWSLTLARARYLYVTVHRRLAMRPPACFLNIERVFHEATGVGLDEYLSVGIGIMTHYLKHKQSPQLLPADSSCVLFCPESYFKETVLAPDLLAGVLRQLVTDVSGLKAAVQGKSRREMAYDYLPFKARPLVRLNTGDLCLVSLQYLLERVTTGVYWILFDHLRRVNGGDAHLQLAQYNGEIFQAYVEELARHIVEREDVTATRLMADVAYNFRGQEQRSTDVMLFADESAVLLEVTASKIKARETISLGSEVSFVDDCRRIVYEKADQMDRVIRHIREGRVPLGDVDPREVKEFYPVVMTMEGLLKNPIIDKYLDEEIRKEGILSGADVKPLSVMTIEDLEAFEKWATSGFIDGLRAWYGSEHFPHQPFGSYVESHLRESGQPILGSWTQSMMDRVLEEAVELMFGKQLAGEGWRVGAGGVQEERCASEPEA